MERMLDLAAERLGLDRDAIRERNLIQLHEFPYDVGLISRDKWGNLPGGEVSSAFAARMQELLTARRV
jgi:CO/xanthine dehydrogenase Mo-binding subunit